jgi:ubiquinone/menaquinone biosynthesis C-methylase UbiE
MANVQEIFDNMATEYDDLSDLWYSWLFSRLHYFISNKVIRKDFPNNVLDIGCGTGFQSYLYAAAGCKVIGIDISNELIKIAKDKERFFDPDKIRLFPEYYDYVKKYNQLIRENIQKIIGKFKYIPPKFYYGDATSISYNDNEFDHINCCGSTLSFIPNYDKAISEFARILKKGGTFLIEVENKWSFNIIWQILDPLVHGKFQINNKFKKGIKFLTKKFTRNIWINFPFGDYDKPVNMRLKLFSVYTLKRELMKYGLKVEKKYSIHFITNLIPCTYLDNLKPSKKLILLFKFLARLEEKCPFYIPGASLVLYGRKI